MSIATTVASDSDDHGSDTMKLCKLLVKSQEAMICRIEASIGSSSAGIEALLSKVIESHNHSQHQMLEMMKMFATNSTTSGVSIYNGAGKSTATDACISNEIGKSTVTSAGISNNAGTSSTTNASTSDEAGGKNSIAMPHNQSPIILVVDQHKEEIHPVFDIESSDNNDKEKEENNQVNPEAVQVLSQVNEPNAELDKRVYSSLLKAVRTKDWEKAMESVKINPTALEEIISTRQDLINEIAAILSLASIDHQWAFVDEIVKLVPPEALEHPMAEYSYTVLHAAAMHGIIKTVKALVKRNPNLTQIRSHKGDGYVPLFFASMKASDGQMEVLDYLYPVTRDYFRSVTRSMDSSPFSAVLMRNLIMANAYGIALSICQEFPELLKELISASETEFDLLRSIVQRLFGGANLTWWERCIYSLIDVGIESPRGHVIKGDKSYSLESSEGVKEDIENPAHTSKDFSVSEGFSTSDKRTMTKNMSMYFTRYLMQATRKEHLFDQKFMDKQALALVKYVLTYMEETMEPDDIRDFFRDSSVLTTAIKYGTTELVLECLQVFPYLCWEDTLTKLAIEERNEKIFNFLCAEKYRGKKGGFLHFDENKNSILHYAAQLTTNRQLSSISGAAFQMQKEMQWFRGVENSMLPKDRLLRNNDGYTAQGLFVKTHKELRENGEKWMKDTSGSCMLVGALIATVAFTAALTVPGGNISDSNSRDNGIPVFLDTGAFMVFAIADAISLFSSITSVLMFLAAYTSRYSETDFIKSLPQKMIIGLATLIISMATILVAFGAAFTIVLGKRFAWAPIVVALLGCIPVLLFGFLQFPLLVEMIHTTYWPITFWEQKRGMVKPNVKKDVDNGTLEEDYNHACASVQRIPRETICIEK